MKISDEEVEFLWGITDEKEAAKKLLDEFGIRLAMITMGPKGAYLANQNGAAYAKCPEVKTDRYDRSRGISSEEARCPDC